MFQSQFSLWTSFFFLVTFFDQNYGLGSSNSTELPTSILISGDFTKQENVSVVKINSLIEEWGKVLDKISRVKRSWSALSGNVEKCQEKLEERNNCMKELLDQVNFGIPSNRHETETACRSFFIAMRCMGEWTRNCLNESDANSFDAYVAPATETYSHICKDKQSRAKFYRHGECYRKITPGFDACVDEMGVKLNALQEDKHAMQICCHQRNFLKCVSRVLSQNECNVASSKATIEMAERTVQFRPEQIIRKNNTKGICIRMTNSQCAQLLRAENLKTNLLSSSTSKSVLCFPLAEIAFGLLLNRIV